MTELDRAYFRLSRAVLENAIEVAVKPVGFNGCDWGISRSDKHATRQFFISPTSALNVFSRMAGFDPHAVRREALARWTS